jgi:DNA-binding response OmpR family regulator
MVNHDGIGGREIRLTQKEQDLLHLLESNPGKCFSRPYLLKEVWGYADKTKTRTVDVHVSRLRKKLRNRKNIGIYSVVRQGYVLQSNGNSTEGSSVKMPAETARTTSAAHV